jgi:hypothetical protein
MLWACFEILLWLHSVHLRRTFPSDLQKMQFRAFCDEEADFGKSARSLVKHLRADVGEAAFRFLIFGCWPKKIEISNK